MNCSNKATAGACVKWGTQNLFLCLYKKIIVTCKMAKNLYEGKNIPSWWFETFETNVFRLLFSFDFAKNILKLLHHRGHPF